jgi:hypothetical protein
VNATRLTDCTSAQLTGAALEQMYCNLLATSIGQVTYFSNQPLILIHKSSASVTVNLADITLLGSIFLLFLRKQKFSRINVRFNFHKNLSVADQASA